MNENTYLNILVESSVISNPKLNPMIEGKTWDKVKKVWRDHKGKIITGAGIATAVAGGLAYRNKSSKTNNTSTTISGSTPQDSTNTNNTTSSSSHKKANDFFDKGREVKKIQLRNSADSISHCPIVNGKRSGRRVMGKVICNT